MKTLGRLIGKSRIPLILALSPLVLLLSAWEVLGLSEGQDGVQGYGVPPTEQFVVRSTVTPTPFQPVAPTLVDDPYLQTIPLTVGGCCVKPMWSNDSKWVMFLDRPSTTDPAGLYGLPAGGGSISLINARVGLYSKDGSLVAYPEDGRTIVERWVDGNRWVVPNGGRAISFAPSGDWVVWKVGSEGINFPDLRQRAIWVAKVDGSEAKEVVTSNGGNLVGWNEDETAIIITGRLAPDLPAGIWRIDLESGAGALLMEVERPRGALISPSGGWVVYTIAFDQELERNGVWVVKTDGTFSRRLEAYGAYRWRREGQLLLIPFDMNEAGLEIWQINPLEDIVWQLTDPEVTHISILNNDWVPSPDGSSLVYLSAEDQNLWIVGLPEP